MKPYIHAESSVKRFGGKVEDYLKIHDWFDQTKSHFGDNRHRAILHSSFGIFLCEQVFGHNITNSDDKLVSVRDIGEQHVVEDLGFIPSVADFLKEMTIQPWMHPTRKGTPAEEMSKIIGGTDNKAAPLNPPKLVNPLQPFIDAAEEARKEKEKQREDNTYWPWHDPNWWPKRPEYPYPNNPPTTVPYPYGRPEIYD